MTGSVTKFSIVYRESQDPAATSLRRDGRSLRVTGLVVSVATIVPFVSAA